MSPCLVSLLGRLPSFLFSRHRRSFQPASVFFVLAQWPVILLINPVGALRAREVR